LKWTLTTKQEWIEQQQVEKFNPLEVIEKDLLMPTKFSPMTSNKEMIDMVKRMAMMAEYRESGISNHLERIRGYCLILALNLDLPPSEAEIISYACQLHDIGKVSLPDNVLSRSDNLTAVEWGYVKRHPIVGADLLKDSQSVVLRVGELIALTHHERWDGTGYPKGLKGEEIPMGGRICALADVFDALTTKRSYKTEVSVEDAIELIRDASDQLFDSQLVSIFSQNIEEIKKIRQHNL